MDTEALKKSLLKKFQEVTADRLQKIGMGVLQLEKPNANEAADEVARELHTMKGEARMLGLSAIGQLAHAAEDLLKANREGKAATGTATDLLLRACDVAQDLLEDLDGAHSGTEASQSMCEALAQASGAEVPALNPQMKQLKKAAPAKKSAPEQQRPAARPAEAAPPPPPIVEAAPAARAAGDEPAVRQSDKDRSIRVNVEILDALGLLAGDLLVESARAKLRSQELNALLQRFARVGDRVLKLGDGLRQQDNAVTGFALLENDLHLLRDDAFRFIRQHADGVNSLHGNLSQLADNVAQARLVPLTTIFEAFPRAVRDIARNQGKDVELVVANADAGVDRSMVTDVRDSLVHLIRNAVDHGIEAPDFRVALGKKPAGALTIRARTDGDMLHVEVEDDGRGMDPERLRATGVARKIITQEQAAGLSDREAIELIFVPGFSTRDEVSDISGRGVGMDVVKRKVEALGGSVSVQSRLGRGTVIALRLPQSLSLMRVLLIRLGDDVYGIPAADVESVMRVRPSDRREVFGTVTVPHRGKPTALVALGPLLALNGGPRHDRPPAVVVRHGQDVAALVVDGFVDEREVAVKPCGGDFMKGAPFIAGTAALEDGRIAVLLQVRDVMNEVRRISRPVTAAAATARRLRVLLVDDSPIARATESALVKALGHTVEEAQDGEEGYKKAEAGEYDLILTDVQMPRMDGFAFTRKLKASSKLQKLPVIILSSLAAPEDRRRGLDAGADAYLIKGELGVESLAQTIDRLT